MFAGLLDMSPLITTRNCLILKIFLDGNQKRAYILANFESMEGEEKLLWKILRNTKRRILYLVKPL